MLVKCMFSGSGGQGSALMAKLVCQGAMEENLKVVMTQSYGIEQRGGDSTANIIISDELIGSPIVENDATVAVANILKKETIEAVLKATMGQKKPELLELNTRAFHRGLEAAQRGE